MCLGVEGGGGSPRVAQQQRGPRVAQQQRGKRDSLGEGGEGKEEWEGQVGRVGGGLHPPPPPPTSSTTTLPPKHMGVKGVDSAGVKVKKALPKKHSLLIPTKPGGKHRHHKKQRTE